AGDGIADGGVSVDLDERRASGDIQAGTVAEAQVGGTCVVGTLTVEELVAEIGEARDADEGGTESVGFLRDEILRALVLSNGEARDTGAVSGNRIELVAVVDHVTEIEGIARREVVVKADATLIVVLRDDLRRGEEIGAGVGQREQAEEIRGERIDVGELIV